MSKKSIKHNNINNNIDISNISNDNGKINSNGNKINNINNSNNINNKNDNNDISNISNDDDINNDDNNNNIIDSDNIALFNESINQIKDIISKPVLVEKNFKNLISIHQSINNMANEYYNASIVKIKKSAKDILLKYCDKFKTEYSTDLKRLNELNDSMKINVNGNKKIKTWNELVFNECNMYKPELFDEEIYYDLNDKVNINIKKEDLKNPKIKKLIKEYNEIKNEIINELDEFMNDIKVMEKSMMRAEGKIEQKGMKYLDCLYVCHLNFLNSVIHKKTCNLKVNGMMVKGKQSEWLKGWFNDV